MTNPHRLFCFGYGYCCDYLGHDLMQRGGWSVHGTTRDPEKKALLSGRGISASFFDMKTPLGDPDVLLRGTTHLLISTPPGDEGDPSFLAHMDDILKLDSLEWVGYLSTTGVYGDRGGEWVDESSERRPTSRRGSRRQKAEDQWLSLYEGHGLPVHIFRLAGIYGPGRSALDSIRAGVARRVDKPGHAFSRIHVEDIVRGLLASMENPKPGRIYNFADDEAVPSHEVIAYACELLGRPVPVLEPYDVADLSPMARSFYNDNKRVRNERMKAELVGALKYGTYREGLKGCLDAEEYAISIFQSKGGAV
jgi:hypothetical protein